MEAPKSPTDAPPEKGEWTLTAAKARLSELVDRAQSGPQVIT
ncbi:MAG: type II toxin-antitoxin system prevent-host-death family antitoxin, partial [Bradyrhizobium sp.]